MTRFNVRWAEKNQAYFIHLFSYIFPWKQNPINPVTRQLEDDHFIRYNSGIKLCWEKLPRLMLWPSPEHPVQLLSCWEISRATCQPSSHKIEWEHWWIIHKIPLKQLGILSKTEMTVNSESYFSVTDSNLNAFQAAPLKEMYYGEV